MPHLVAQLVYSQAVSEEVDQTQKSWPSRTYNQHYIVTNRLILS